MRSNCISCIRFNCCFFYSSSVILERALSRSQTDKPAFVATNQGLALALACQQEDAQYATDTYVWRANSGATNIINQCAPDNTATLLKGALNEICRGVGCTIGQATPLNTQINNNIFRDCHLINEGAQSDSKYVLMMIVFIQRIRFMFAQLWVEQQRMIKAVNNPKDRRALIQKIGKARAKGPSLQRNSADCNAMIAAAVGVSGTAQIHTRIGQWSSIITAVKATTQLFETAADHEFWSQLVAQLPPMNIVIDAIRCLGQRAPELKNMINSFITPSQHQLGRQYDDMLRITLLQNCIWLVINESNATPVREIEAGLGLGHVSGETKRDSEIER